VTIYVYSVKEIKIIKGELNEHCEVQTEYKITKDRHAVCFCEGSSWAFVPCL